MIAVKGDGFPQHEEILGYKLSPSPSIPLGSPIYLKDSYQPGMGVAIKKRTNSSCLMDSDSAGAVIK